MIETQIIEYLLKTNKIDEKVLAGYKKVKEQYSTTIGYYLLNSGIIGEDEYLKLLHQILNIDLFDNNFEIKKIDLPINIDYLFKNNLYPFYETDEEYFFAVNYSFKLDEIIKIQNILNKDIKLFLAIGEQLLAIKELYFEENSDKDLLDVDESDEEIEKLKELASEAPVIKLINKHFNKAIEYKASDIHYETFKKGMKVRFRIDGVLRTFDKIPHTLKMAIIARLKLLSKMNIAENRLPQDGRISIKAMNKEIDIRASSIPTAFGESFVLRLLGKQNISYSLFNLGFDEYQLNIINNIIQKPNGIFLTTGPTGSGKTTTLYSMLNELNNDNVKIITVEDPVEYELDGVNQIQVKSEIGFTFANALRSILRQDPDIIMIGEIRDVETANIAIQSALTGHFVLSTLHTNSALGAITRLLDMGVEFFLLKASIKGLMAQRLVRKLCPYCKEEIKINKEIKDVLKIDNLVKKYNIDNINTFKAVGCEKCASTGYIGRMPVSEIIPFDEKVQDIIENNRNFNDISKFGYRNLFEDATLKFLRGETTYEEIVKVI